VVHSQAKTGGAGNTTSVWRKQVEGFGNGAELIRVAAVAYFVAPSPLNGEPALMRCELPCSAEAQWEEPVPGVENLQVWYRRGTETELPTVLYRHGLVLQLEGGYFDLLQYLQAVHASGWKLNWDSLDYRVGEAGPGRAKISLKLFTLSRKAGWVGV
jgi:hypothetical protein